MIDDQAQSDFFLGIGAAKCGTTTVARLLMTHPEIGFHEKGKEAHFFDYPEHVNAESFQRYLDKIQPGKVRGEWTPSYLFTPESRDLIEEWLGRDLKFIVALRNPVDRAFSHYCHAVNHWDTPEMAARGYPPEPLSFQEALDAEEERLASGRYHVRHQSYFAKGLYARQLRWYFEVFDPERFYIYLLEEHTADPAANMRQLCEFLGVDPSHRFPDVARVTNSETFGQVAHDVRVELWKRYEPDIADLEHLLGRDLSLWAPE